MENLKVKVNSESESKEVQELFFDAGCSWGGVYGTCVKTLKFPRFIAYSGKFILSDCIEHNFNFNNAKEITLLQLRDLVVLKRNLIDDANYECNGKKYFLSSTGNNHCWHKVARKGVPVFEWVQCGTPLIPEFKPIEKPMKEYLRKNSHGTYSYIGPVHTDHVHDLMIEIPDGADTFAGDDNCHYFWQHRVGKKNLLIGCGSSLERYPEWTDCKDSAEEWLSNFYGDNSLCILWQRNQEKKQAEFLVKTDERYILQVLDINAGGDFVRVPEGAEVCCVNYEGSLNFYKEIDGKWALKNNYSWDEWYIPNGLTFPKGYNPYSGELRIVWKRETLNDQVASAETARQSEKVLKEILEGNLPEFDFEAIDAFIESNVEQGQKHSHYKKDVSYLNVIDIYRVTEMFKPHSCGAHIVKKALCSGQRGHKDLLTDIQDIIDTAERWKEMLIEDENSCKD